MNIEPKIKTLITHRILGVETADEAILIEEWRQRSEQNELLYRSLVDHDRLIGDLELYQSLNWEKAYEKVHSSGTKTLSITRRIMQWAAVFIFAALTSLSVYFFIKLEDPKNQVAQQMEQPGSKARLIKSDGSVIDLLAEKSFQFDEAAGVDVKSEDGEVIVYSGDNKERSELAASIYNTLEVPRGGEYKLILGDGTHIWLNAETTLKYPVAFDGKERAVYLTGEAYFDVAKGERPFIVHTQGGAVEVLGTQFNVKAYMDEAVEFITLEEGAVRVRNRAGDSEDIKPGYQIENVKSEAQLSVKSVHTAYYTGWRNGVFRFDGETLEGVMSALARWYDFEYSFEKAETKNLHFTGTLKRYDSALKVFGMIEQTSNVKIIIANDQIIIK